MRKKKTQNELKVSFDLPSTWSAVSRPAVMVVSCGYFTACFSLTRRFQGRCILCCRLLPKLPCFLGGCLPFRLPCGACFSLDICTCTVCHRVAMNDGAAALAADLQTLAVPRLLMWYHLLPAPGDKPPVTPDCHVDTLVCWFKNFLGGKNNFVVAGLDWRYQLRYAGLKLWVFVQFLVVFKAGIQRRISFLSENAAASVNLLLFF